jgi:hypothetical protein
MTRSARPRRAASLRLERMEGREVPANLTVTFAPATHTLTVVGDEAANDVVITGDLFDPTGMTVSSPTDVINGSAVSVTVLYGVYNLDVRLGGGDDRLTLGGTPASPDLPVILAGRLSINGGDGANTVIGTRLRVDRGATIVNGAGYDWTDLSDVLFRGSLTVQNGAGGSQVSVYRTSPGAAAINGSVRVTNGAGADFTFVSDLTAGGGVSVRNGAPAPGGSAGAFVLGNYWNTTQSQVHGGVSASFAGGNGYVAVGDVEVGKGVALAYGAGSFITTVDGSVTGRPTTVWGGLTVSGTGRQSVSLGTGGSSFGLEVGGNLSVTTGGQTDTLNLYRARVGGSTGLRLGDGGNLVRVDDSVFTGAFGLTTGTGADNILVDTLPGTTSPTTFRGPGTIREGAGVDTLTLGGVADPGQLVEVRAPVVIHHGAGGMCTTRSACSPCSGRPSSTWSDRPVWAGVHSMTG